MSCARLSLVSRWVILFFKAFLKQGFTLLLLRPSFMAFANMMCLCSLRLHEHAQCCFWCLRCST